MNATSPSEYIWLHFTSIFKINSFNAIPSTIATLLRLSTAASPMAGGMTRMGMQNISGRVTTQTFTLANAASIKIALNLLTNATVILLRHYNYLTVVSLN
jgi:hypothetical protein